MKFPLERGWPQHKTKAAYGNLVPGQLYEVLTPSLSLSREIPVWLDEAKYLAIFRRFLLPTTHVIRLAGLTLYVGNKAQTAKTDYG